MWRNRLLYLLGGSILILGLIQGMPLLIALTTNDPRAVGPFFTSFTLTNLIGASLFLGFRGAQPVRTPALTVLLPCCVLVCLAVAAALPFYFLFPEDGFAPALFEGASFITTSGASAYPAGNTPVTFELWRGLVAWIGGFGAVLYSLSLVTALNSGGQQLHASSLPFGDSKEGYSRLYSTAAALFPLYVLITCVFSIIFVIEGVPLFPSFLLAIGGVSTTSLPGYLGWVSATPWIQISFLLLMIAGAGNWDMLQAFFEGKKRSLLRDPESRTMITVLAFSILALLIIVSATGEATTWSIFFHSISAVSGTGVSLAGTHAPPTETIAIGVIFMILVALGGGSTSTTGGVRQLRFLVIMTLGRSELDRLAHPNGARALRVGKSPLTPRDGDAVYLLVGGFVVSLLLGSLLLGVQGVSFKDSMALALAAITLSGPASELMAPGTLGYTALTNSDYVILTILMLIGRVEATVFLALFTHSLWRR